MKAIIEALKIIALAVLGIGILLLAPIIIGLVAALSPVLIVLAGIMLPGALIGVFVGRRSNRK